MLIRLTGRVTAQHYPEIAELFWNSSHSTVSHKRRVSKVNSSERASRVTFDIVPPHQPSRKTTDGRSRTGGGTDKIFLVLFVSSSPSLLLLPSPPPLIHAAIHKFRLFPFSSLSLSSALLCHNFEALTLNFCRDGGRPSSEEEEIGSLREQEVQVHAAFTRNDFEFLRIVLRPRTKESLREMDGIRDSGKIYEHARSPARARPRRRVASSPRSRPSSSLWSGISPERAPRLALGSTASVIVISDGGPNPKRGILDWGFMWILT